MRGLSLVAASGATLHRGARASHCRGLSLRSTGSRRAGSAIVAHGPSHSVACGIFPDQGSNPCPLHWQADSQPLRHQGSPPPPLFELNFQYMALVAYREVYVSGRCCEKQGKEYQKLMTFSKLSVKNPVVHHTKQHRLLGM